VKTEKARPQ